MNLEYHSTPISKGFENTSDSPISLNCIIPEPVHQFTVESPPALDLNAVEISNVNTPLNDGITDLSNNFKKMTLELFSTLILDPSNIESEIETILRNYNTLYAKNIVQIWRTMKYSSPAQKFTF